MSGGGDVCGIGAEIDGGLRQHIKEAFPRVGLFAEAEAVTVKKIWPTIVQSGCSRVLLMAGPPCQPWSSLGPQQGRLDARADAIDVFVNLLHDLRTACRKSRIPFDWLMEEVASMSKESRDLISDKLETTPVAVNAADWGYVHRPRLIWSTAEVAKLGRHTSASFDGIDVVRWTGPPSPKDWKPQGNDARWRSRGMCGKKASPIDGSDWAPSYPTGRFLCFTRAFPHPADRAGSCDEHTLLRFNDDGRRFPVYQYTEGNMVSDAEGNLRPLNATERFELMGFPSGFASSLEEEKRLAAIGNAWHLPSLLIFVKAILDNDGLSEQSEQDGVSSSSASSSLPSSFAPPPRIVRNISLNTTQAEVQPQGTHSGGIGHFWDNERTCNQGDSAKETLDNALSMFPPKFFPSDMVDKAASDVQGINLGFMRKYEKWSKENLGCFVDGLDFDALYRQTPHGTQTTKKRGTPTQSIPPDLDAESHLAEAKAMRHPYDLPAKLEADLEFAVKGSAAAGPASAKARGKNLDTLRVIQRALSKLDSWALSKRPSGHVPGFRPVFIAFLLEGMKWPDRSLPWDLVQGVELVGTLHSSNIFRHVSNDPSPVQEALAANFLGKAASDYVDDLESDRRVSPMSAEIWKETMKEVELGLCGEPVTRDVLDAKFGRGNWRPLPRHIIAQGDKLRPIDDGKRSSHNDATLASETILCCRPSVIAAAALEYTRELSALSADNTLPEWFGLVAGTEDLWKGYRQMHALERDQAVAIASFVKEDGVRVYTELFGLPFGLMSAVIQFNRVPCFITACLRRLLLMMTSHYFDDSSQLELEQIAAITKTQVIRFFGLCQVQIGHDKRQYMMGVVKFLGTLTDLTRIQSDDAIVLGPWPSTRRKTIALIDGFLERGSMTSAQASKLRGTIQWLDIDMMGRPCRGALGALIARQYFEKTVEIHDNLRDSLLFLKYVAGHLPDRQVKVFGSEQPPVVIYTDASTGFGKDGLRIGAVLFDPLLPSAPCCVVDIPLQAQSLLIRRKTQIMPAELLAIPVVLLGMKDMVTNRDVIWFIDNQSALAALIKSASAAPDCAGVALKTGLLTSALNVRVWYEYVPSKQNVSDPLSRGGFDDREVKENLKTGKYYRLEIHTPWSTIIGGLQETMDLITALGIAQRTECDSVG